MTIERALKLCQQLDLESLSKLDSQLKDRGHQPLPSSKPGLRRDYDFEGVRLSVMEKPNDGFHFLEFYFELMLDKDHLEGDAYEAHLAHYRALWDKAVGRLSESLGAPLFRGNWEEDDFPDSCMASETAVWAFGEARLRVEYRDDGPEVPSWLGLVLEPPS